ncbi:MAG: acetyl-CoA carboxylase biotin carboxyl carrier protein [Acidimicrobiales bacterium]|nr:acetyl-CoA carboxylase biotin carboxyl carrier protein [Hyphomonadaceae bacterium]RZV35153.1 MAG: acetyl-CoA carboxylase biotin carboxyl carrier protein [Acidimicrobiales bacterium]
MAQKPGKTSAVETKLIRELAKILNDTDLSEIEMEKGDLRLRVARGTGPVTVAHAAPAPTPAAASTPAAQPSEAAPAPAAPADNPNAVKSPMVGTAYVRPSPDKDPFVNVGDKVKEGDTVLLVEAMKTFNPIKAPRSGTVTEILVQDAQPVEFGEALIIIG